MTAIPRALPAIVAAAGLVCMGETPTTGRRRSEGASRQETRVTETARLERMAARFAPTDIGADLSALSAAERQVLAKLVQASKVFDAVYLRQVWAGNETMLLDLIAD